MLRVQKIEAGDRDFDIVANRPADSRIQLHILGNPGIGKLADIAQIRIQSDSMPQIH